MTDCKPKLESPKAGSREPPTIARPRRVGSSVARQPSLGLMRFRFFRFKVQLPSEFQRISGFRVWGLLGSSQLLVIKLHPRFSKLLYGADAFPVFANCFLFGVLELVTLGCRPQTSPRNLYHELF